jgi:tetratricopeptide (TPR) repeat protein
LRETVSIDPDDPRPYNDFGRSLALQEQFHEAFEQFHKAEEKWRKKESKDRKIALRDWGWALRLQKHYDQATEKCREAIRVDEDEPLAYYYLGYVFTAQKRFDDAIEQFSEADERWRKKESKERKKALWAWADALRQQKNYEKAVEKYREAIGIDQDDPWTYYYLGVEFANQELFDKAIEQYGQADELLSKDALSNCAIASP